MMKLVFLVFMAMAVAFGEAATITVEGSDGWSVPSNADFYDQWKDSQNIVVGDTLVFNFAQGAHDVARVTEAAYKFCDLSSPIFSELTPPFSFTINDTSHYYFVCTIGKHCARGQKLAVTDVKASSSATSSSSSSPPSNSAQSLVASKKS